VRSYLEKKPHHKKKAGRVAQGVGPGSSPSAKEKKPREGKMYLITQNQPDSENIIPDVPYIHMAESGAVFHNQIC
jgi:hypothetical protein